jgi:rhodanese-related sulfurtransferase
MAEDYNPRTVADLLSSDEIQLIDVRAEHDYDAGRIAGGRLLELTRLSAEAHTIDRSKPVVFYCRTGSRSAMATEAFAQAGYDAHNMAGGMVEWEAAGLPIEPDGGYVADP